MYDMLQMLPKIVNMTLAASFAGCVVLLLRAVLRKVPAGYFYALWLMVFLRFLCPFTWESAVSLIPVRGDAVTYKSFVSAGVNVYAGVSAANARAERTAVIAPHTDRKSTRLNSSHLKLSRMPSSA